MPCCAVPCRAGAVLRHAVPFCGRQPLPGPGRQWRWPAGKGPRRGRKLCRLRGWGQRARPPGSLRDWWLPPPSSTTGKGLAGADPQGRTDRRGAEQGHRSSRAAGARRIWQSPAGFGNRPRGCAGPGGWRHREDTLGTHGDWWGGPWCHSLPFARCGRGDTAGWLEGTAQSPCQHRGSRHPLSLQPAVGTAIAAELGWGDASGGIGAPISAVTPGYLPQRLPRHHAFTGGAAGPQAEHLQAASCPGEAGSPCSPTPWSPAPGHPAGRGWPSGEPGRSPCCASLTVCWAPGTLQAGGAAGRALPHHAGGGPQPLAPLRWGVSSRQHLPLP